MSRLAYHAEHFKRGSVNALAQHNYQKRGKYDHHSNQDIDPSRSHLNVQLVAPEATMYKDIKKAIEERCTGRVTAGSNWLSETIVYPPDDILDNRDNCISYFRDVLEWHKIEFGEENIKSSVAHFDETTPHLHTDLIPFTEDGRLSSKEVFARNNLYRHHTELAAYLQDRGWDIQRGESTKDKQVKSKSVPGYKKEAERRKLELQAEIDDLTERLQGLTDAVEPYQWAKDRIDEIEAVEVKIKGLGAKKRAEMDLAVWNKVVPIVKREWSTQVAYSHLQESCTRQQWEIDRLQEGNATLSRENADLKEQNQQLQRDNSDLSYLQAFVSEFNLADQYRRWYIKQRSEREQSRQDDMQKNDPGR